jgi:hypothetical protein
MERMVWNGREWAVAVTVVEFARSLAVAVAAALVFFATADLGRATRRREGRARKPAVSPVRTVPVP